VQWKEFFAGDAQNLFHETEFVLSGKRIPGAGDRWYVARCGVPCEEVFTSRSCTAYLRLDWILNHEGVLDLEEWRVYGTSRAVATVVDETVRGGVDNRVAQIAEPSGPRR